LAIRSHSFQLSTASQFIDQRGVGLSAFCGFCKNIADLIGPGATIQPPNHPLVARILRFILREF
jgi:hypothetical protein